MKNILIIIVALMVTACASKENRFPEAFVNPDPDSQIYRIGCGDVLYISVWKEEALTRQAAVLPDGNITFPLIGIVKAKGKTVEELKADITAKLTKYMSGSNLSVEVLQPNSMMVYVIGKVNSPGNINMHESMTVMQALTLARGLNTFADKKDIRIFRKIDDQEYIFYFNYNEFIKGNNPTQNITLKRGDMIVVP